MVWTSAWSIGEPCAKLRVIVSEPVGSTPNTRQSGFSNLIAAEAPPRRPPPPMAMITASRSGTCSSHSAPERRRAERGIGAFERVDERAALVAGDRLDHLEGGAAVGRDHHLGAERRQAATRAGLAEPIITTLAVVPRPRRRRRRRWRGCRRLPRKCRARSWSGLSRSTFEIAPRALKVPLCWNSSSLRLTRVPRRQQRRRSRVRASRGPG